MEKENKPVSLKAIHQMLFASRSQQQTQLGVTSCESIPPKGRGRGSIALEKLKNITAANANTSSKPDGYLGTVDASKVVASNAVRVNSCIVYEYKVDFIPELIDRTTSTSVLRMHFNNIGQKYICDSSSLYLPTKLRDTDLKCSLSNTSLPETITLTFTFIRQKDLNYSPDLLKKIFDAMKELQANNVCSKPSVKIMRNYMYTIRHCKVGPLLFAGCRYYIIHSKNIVGEVSDLKNQFPDGYHEALDVFLSKVYVYNKSDKEIYRFCEISWENSVLELKKPKSERCVSVAFEHCHMAEIVDGVKPYTSESPGEVMTDIKNLITSEEMTAWNLKLDTFITAKARVLPLETVTFGDGVTCTPANGSWRTDMLQNEVVTSIELWCWVILHIPSDEPLAKLLGHKIQELQADTGVNIGKPLFFQIKSDSMDGYIDALNGIINEVIQFIIILAPNSPNKPEVLVKHICYVQKPVPCHLISALDVRNTLKLQETVLLINGMLGGSLWTINLPGKNWMISGINVRTAFDNKTLPVCSFVTSFSDDATQWYSKAVFLEQDFNNHLMELLTDALKKYRSTNGVFPSNIILYHACTEDTKEKVFNNYCNFRFNDCTKELLINNLKICIILVQKDSNVCYYKHLSTGYFNVPVGTIVDSEITDLKSQDFFLVSRTSAKEIARPTHYKIIKNTCGFKADEIQSLTYKLCHLYYKQPETVEMPAPCMYAEKLSKLITDTIRHIPSNVLDEYLYYL